MTDICFVSPGTYAYLDPDTDEPRGGSQRQQYLIGQELASRGYGVAYLVGEYGQPREQHIDGLTAVSGSFERMPSLRALPGKLYRFFRAIRRIDADVYYVRGAPRLAILTAIGCMFFRKPYIFCVANDADLEPDSLQQRYGPLVRTLYKRMLTRADRIIAQTPYQQQLLADTYALDSVQIPNGYDLPPDGEVLSTSDRANILWVGSSNPTQKRPELFLDLARSIPDEEFVLISKPTTDKAYHRRLEQEAAQVSNLEFIGGVSPDEVHEYYRRAKLLVNTSTTEGFPNTFLEAWRYGTPVVSLSFDLEDVLTDGKGGALAGDQEALVREVATLASDVDRRETLTDDCRSLVRDRFALETVVDRYEQLLGELTTG